ncbi:MAG TPA: 23S rRNA (uracil(1939)-C(5))-methyltransferase RlmD, partial [Ktedonobacterales bacterium]|nr:23S rRNA (uracil(1939)-C(5))-methyltransferase RlmD [Ktedonobacterales bacterium]
DAVGRHQGRAVFVPGGIPGERVRIRIVSERKNYARGELVEVVQASPDRVALRYPDLAESGGFQWQHIAYPTQLGWKTHIVGQLLQRVGHFTQPPVRPTIGMPEGSDLWRYRTVAQFAIGPDGAIGFRRANSRDVLDMPACPLVHPALDALYTAVRNWIRAHWGAAASSYAERFTLRVAANPLVASDAPGVGMDGMGLLTIEARTASAFASVENISAFAESIQRDLPGLAGIVILGIPGGHGRIVAGSDFIYERVLNKTYRVSAGSFFQVNAAQTPVLVREARLAAQPRPTDHLLDGYSGVGLFALILADDVATVHAIESQPSAVADARASAILNGTANVVVTEGILERVLGAINPEQTPVDLVLVDPPRAGCLPRALSEIQRLAPRTFIYVSCDPSTLARDLRVMCDNGYQLTSVQPVDMFPFTSHIECVARCERVER